MRKYVLGFNPLAWIEKAINFAISLSQSPVIAFQSWKILFSRSVGESKRFTLWENIYRSIFSIHFRFNSIFKILIYVILWRKWTIALTVTMLKSNAHRENHWPKKRRFSSQMGKNLFDVTSFRSQNNIMNIAHCTPKRDSAIYYDIYIYVFLNILF